MTSHLPNLLSNLTSRMHVAADQITDWTHRNVIEKKEMLFGRIAENPPPQVTFNTDAVGRVTSFKLLEQSRTT